MPVELSPNDRARADLCIQYHNTDLLWIRKHKGMESAAFHLGVAIGAKVNTEETNPDGISTAVVEYYGPLGSALVDHGKKEWTDEFIRGFKTQYSQWDSTKTPDQAFEDWKKRF